MTMMVPVRPQPCPSTAPKGEDLPGAGAQCRVQRGQALAGASPWLRPSSRQGGGAGLSQGPLDLSPPPHTHTRARAHLEARL